ncbi:MAG: glycosyltransferase family 4 protein, partial [Gammaproteobacteria bacterium]
PEAQAKAFNDSVVNAARALRDDDPPAFIYQRYGVNNFSGVELARHWGVPLLLEYNGSEIWVNRNWGRSLGDEEGALRIETLNLKSADLVVPVSEVLGDELLERGVPRERILVNANGVDPDRYHPDVAAGRVRERLGLGARRVIGFIGTFGPWHGAEMLLESFIQLLDLRPDLDDVHLLLIGDGAAMPSIRRRIAEAGVAARVSLPGRVPQALGPDYLAACDVLVSPHVPNADGSRFFGSPTKLFEYMAMGRPIVASDLEQIGALLTHEETALLVPPAEPEALARAVARLLDDTALGERLAAQARRVVMDRHSWARHTQRSLAGLQRVSGLDLGFT